MPLERNRVGWWLFVLALAGVVGYVLYSFVGMVVLGVAAYYGTRPLHRRLERVVGSSWVAAATTLLGIFLPVLLLVGYAGFQFVHSIDLFVGAGGAQRYRQILGQWLGFGPLPDVQVQQLARQLRNPTEALRQYRDVLRTAFRLGANALAALTKGLLLVGLSLTLAYYLLRFDDRLAAIFESVLGGEGSTAHAYATAVDRDLQSVYFGNLAFVVVMSVVAAVVYYGASLLAPPSLSIPMPLVLAVLTGAASIVPVVVGKIVYVPLVLYLAVQAVRTNAVSLWFPAVLLVACVLVLDLLPQAFLQPYLSGQRLGMGLLLFAYLLGPMLFGWYGFFLLPLVTVLVVQVVRLVLAELVRGEPLTPWVSAPVSMGSDPAVAREGGSRSGGDRSESEPDESEQTE
ncbi:AI-2E family transporter [Haloprofundus salilacus]|uniref:AI-2E family transporter n=1 Tax=Haloprofundus salilacus TaxID=2876190 RepID=UPI001CCF66B7|nr:AI-2E family transporter [Haloprofundus salilacus]